MRETVFLQQNADKWQRFETLLDDESADPDRLADLFVEITDDLAYARTHYPDSNTTRYLNGLAMDVHQAVYKRRKTRRNRFVRFWAYEVPQAAYRARRELLIAALVLALAIGIGAISAAGDQGFTRLILGDRYVNMTLANIEQGDPMAVYKGEAAVDMFLGITLNNVRVAFLAFAAGIVGSVGTAYMLFTNGVMLGAFHFLFFQHDLLTRSLLVVYIHGALEIPAIIVAGAAGLVMGNSLLFPGTYPRLESLRRGARHGVKLAVGLVPVFLAAGLLEGFVTRHTDMPLALSLGIIGCSLAFIAAYFVIYPHVLFVDE